MGTGGLNLGHRFYATEGRDSFELALTSVGKLWLEFEH